MNPIRLLLLTASLACLLVASCKKSDTTDPGSAGSNGWKLNGTFYKKNSLTNTGDMFYAYDTSSNGISFSFASYPTTDGVYTVVGNSASLGPGQVKVDAFGPTSGSTYFATGNDHTSATVTISGAFLKITLPDTWALRGGSSTDSQKLSATLSPN